MSLEKKHLHLGMFKCKNKLAGSACFWGAEQISSRVVLQLFNSGVAMVLSSVCWFGLNCEPINVFGHSYSTLPLITQSTQNQFSMKCLGLYLLPTYSFSNNDYSLFFGLPTKRHEGTLIFTLLHLIVCATGIMRVIN